ncbi:MAG TPA: DUF4956 domain-containing protein [Vicinamibacterales bacterium]|nr:DUF4956 domain-containing protein [Vicinamibacterales bacterium]
MPEFLRTVFSSPAINPLDVLLRLVAAVVLGGGVAWIYRGTRDPNDAGPTFPATLVLLSVLIAASTQVIGDNVARAFSLVGALSIVRFRTVVRDTQDTAFVIFAVVTGMAVGAGDLAVAGICFAVVGVAALVMKPRAVKSPVSGAAFLVTIRAGLGHDIEAIAGPLLDAHMARRQLVGMTTAKQGLAVDVTFRGALKEGANVEQLVKTLNRTEGIQSVELTRQPALED